jgi:putative drug exporter of the RND superfamily
VIAAWVVAAVLAHTFLPTIEEAETSPLGGLVSPDARAIEVEIRSAELFGVPLLSRVAVVQRDPAGLGAAEHRRVAERALRINRREDELLASIVFALPITNAGRLFPASRESGTTAITYLYFLPDRSVRAREALGHTYASRIEQDGDSLVGVTGAMPARMAQSRAIERALPRVELATVLLIALILAVAYRAPGPPLVVLAAAGIAYVVSVRVVAWFGQTLEVSIPRDVQPVMVVLVLGIVTDYAVFFLSGVRRRLAEGDDPHTAAFETARRYVPIIGTAGLIVTFGTAALLVGRLEFFRAFGPGAALTVLVVLAVSLTLVPAVLAAFGSRLFWPSLRRTALDEDRVSSSLLDRLARALVRPRFAAGAAAATLLVLGGIAAAGVNELRLGFTLLRGFPETSEVRRAAAAAGAGFVPGIVSPTEVLVEGDGIADVPTAFGRLQDTLERFPGVAGVVGPRQLPPEVGIDAFVTPDRSAVRFVVILDEEPLSAPAIDRIRRLERSLPGMLANAEIPRATAALAGDTALARETVDSVVDDIRRIAIAALLANFLLLALFLRALLAPLYLLAASTLSLAAALGIAALVFQPGLGHPDLTYYVPFVAAVLLLSLGSDYNLFLIGRIWQEAHSRSLREAVVFAMPRASAAISVAGIALAFSFALLALVPLQPFREFAFVMCVGVLLDAFVVRTLLVPALITLVGERSWWPGAMASRGRPEPEPAAGYPSPE